MGNPNLYYSAPELSEQMERMALMEEEARNHQVTFIEKCIYLHKYFFTFRYYPFTLVAQIFQ